MLKSPLIAASLAALIAPGAAMAAGGGSSTAPKPTETTTTCENGQVWDKDAQACVNPQSGALSPEELIEAVRELAYAGQYENARKVLAAMPDQTAPGVQTYLGFTARKMGDMAAGMAHYEAALAQDPSDLLARSYMGQALVEMGDSVGAYKQLLAIRDHGGTGTWAEASLRGAIETGTGYSY
ncbi:hypothetical protein [Roseovarius aquimarinus]|uniref:Tetratricopeptide repeat protein n=1 Tax=Roseovarius aquimarinus TaxID=1229156 RepID=A0ABW7IAM5_9RHOB